MHSNYSNFKNIIKGTKHQTVSQNVAINIGKYQNEIQSLRQHEMKECLLSLKVLIEPYGFLVKQKADLMCVLQNVANSSSMQNVKIETLDKKKYLDRNKKTFIKEHAALSNHYDFKTYIASIVPIMLFSVQETDDFINKISSTMMEFLLTEEKGIKYKLATLKANRKLLTMLAYLLKIGWIEISTDNTSPQHQELLVGLMQGVSEVKIMSWSTQNKNKNDLMNLQGIGSKHDIFGYLFSSSYKIRYISGKYGKHSSHKSPIPHVRKEHERKLRNGHTIIITAMNVNSGKTMNAA